MRVGHEELEDAAVAENDAAALVDELPDVFADDRTKGGGGAGLEQMEDVARPDAALEELFEVGLSGLVFVWRGVVAATRRRFELITHRILKLSCVPRNLRAGSQSCKKSRENPF